MWYWILESDRQGVHTHTHLNTKINQKLQIVSYHSHWKPDQNNFQVIKKKIIVLKNNYYKGKVFDVYLIN